MYDRTTLFLNIHPSFFSILIKRGCVDHYGIYKIGLAPRLAEIPDPLLKARGNTRFSISFYISNWRRSRSRYQFR
jgi:hypothetical protein